jgi:hypothetical protein
MPTKFIPRNPISQSVLFQIFVAAGVEAQPIYRRNNNSIEQLHWCSVCDPCKLTLDEEK